MTRYIFWKETYMSDSGSASDCGKGAAYILKRDLFRVKGHLYDKIHILEREKTCQMRIARQIVEKKTYIFWKETYLWWREIYIDEERPTWQRYLLKRDLFTMKRDLYHSIQIKKKKCQMRITRQIVRKETCLLRKETYLWWKETYALWHMTTNTLRKTFINRKESFSTSI